MEDLKMLTKRKQTTRMTKHRETNATEKLIERVLAEEQRMKKSIEAVKFRLR